MSNTDVSSQLFGPTTSVADQLFQNSTTSASVADQLFSNTVPAPAPAPASSVADQLFGSEPDEDEDDDLGMEDEDEDEDADFDDHDFDDHDFDDDDDDGDDDDDESDDASSPVINTDAMSAQLFGRPSAPTTSVTDQLFGSSPEAPSESVANQLFGTPLEAVQGMSEEAYNEGIAAFAASAFLADLLKPKVGSGVVFNVTVNNLIINN